MITLHVETETTADDGLEAGESRGQLVCRFIRSLRGQVIRGLDTGVQHMSLGEHSMIKVRYDHAYASFSMVIFSFPPILEHDESTAAYAPLKRIFP